MEKSCTLLSKLKEPKNFYTQKPFNFSKAKKNLLKTTRKVFFKPKGFFMCVFTLFMILLYIHFSIPKIIKMKEWK